MTQIISASHISPCCVKVEFDGPMRVDSELLDPTNYTVGGGKTITAVTVTASQNQPYDSGDPNPNGGAPLAVYLVIDEPYTFVSSYSGGVTAGGKLVIVDFNGSVLTGPDTALYTTRVMQDITYWEADGHRTREVFREFGRIGRGRFTALQPMNYSMAHMIGKLGELMAGGITSKLASAIDGPSEPSYPTTFSASGFASSPIPIPGIGSTFSFEDGVIPCHIDKLWGRADGENTTFRASNQFHPFACILIAIRGPSDWIEDGVMIPQNWLAPNDGYDRQFRLRNPPPEGATVLAVYIPRRSLLKIGKEIIAYDESDIVNGTAVIYGRNQLMSALVSHSIGSLVEDVWCASFVERTQINMLAFGASGRPLEYIAMDEGCPRSDNPRLNDTQLRRMIFHTGVSMRGVPGTVWEGIRYIYPNLWPFVIVGEDPRWPGCVVMWYSTDTVIGDQSWITSPPVEPWEVWLDELTWLDGYPVELMFETYYRDDGVDAGFYGDFYLEDYTEDPENWPFPIIISGPEIHILGDPAPSIPPPMVSGSVIDTTYKSYLVRPPALDKVLPAGCGVLLIDFSLM